MGEKSTEQRCADKGQDTLADAKRLSGTKRKNEPPLRSESDGPTKEELAKMSRSEKKSYREKKRRDEVNQSIEELTSVLNAIDPEIVGATGPEDEFCMSRANLIRKSVDVLRVLNEKYEQNKRARNAFEGERGAAPLDSRAEIKNSKWRHPTSSTSSLCSSSDTEVASSSDGFGTSRISERQILVVVPYLEPVQHQHVDHSNAPTFLHKPVPVW
eukprot:CAMPEP_0194041606 /NCGR_PEP_ID=MMETSP0009_2-20130614/13490_1 /TAXON_ID=210454 /ORGANISM="Grammatophora oceanica, Strain CCMP 410" /LENGTH=213 /DNA_ID=CAMNT_0038685171 /DNA_START=319 /DNA_END=957 /DNA_ORIENTATION=+